MGRWVGGGGGGGGGSGAMVMVIVMGAHAKLARVSKKYIQKQTMLIMDAS